MGRPVRLVGGTTGWMPDTAVNQAAYPQSRGQKPGVRLPDFPDGGDRLSVQWCRTERGIGSFSRYGWG